MPFQAMAIYDIFLFTVQNYKKMPASACGRCANNCINECSRECIVSLWNGVWLFESLQIHILEN